MSIFLAIAAAGVTYMSGPMTTLDAQEVQNLGINITAQNYNRELTVDPGPLFFQIDLAEFRACRLRGLGLNVRDENGTEIFGASINDAGGRLFPFRLAEIHVDSTTIAISCDSGPDRLDQVYLFELEEAIEAQ
jgi:hypothetical protein